MSDFKGIRKKIAVLLTVALILPGCMAYAGEQENTVSEDETEISESVSIKRGEDIEILGDGVKYKYRVRHWKQKITGDPGIHDADNYALADTDTAKEATAGSYVAPNTKTYTGFSAPEGVNFLVAADNNQYFDYYYTRNKYNIIINTTDGIDSVTGDGEYYYEENVTITAAVQDGYSFSGWTGDKTSKLSSYTFKLSTAKDLNITANAKATSGIGYQVNYWQQNVDGNPDIEDEENYTLAAHNNLTGDAFAEVTPKVTAYTGFVSPSPQTKQITPDGKMVINYYYKRKTCTITLLPGEGVESVSGGGDYPYGANVSINAALTPGYGFKKWTGTTSYSTNPAVFTATKDITLTATAEIKKYSVTYYLDGGKNAKSNPAKYMTSDIIILLDPEKEGYFFLGWYTDPSFENKVTTIGAGMSGDLNLYAKWLERIRTIKVSYDVLYQNSGTPIDLSKLRISSTLSNGETEEVDPKLVTLSKEYVDFGDNEITVEYDGAKDTFTVSSNIMTLVKGQKYTVSGMGKTGGEKGYKVYSTNKKIAKLNKKGVVIAKKQPGECTVTAQHGDGTTTEFTVFVEVPQWTKKIKTTKGNVQNVGMTGVTQKMEYETSDKNIAKVDKEGNITAGKKGKAVVTTVINGMKFKTKVTVE